MTRLRTALVAICALWLAAPAGYAATLNYMILLLRGGMIGISANGTVVSNFPGGGTSTVNGGYDVTVDSQGNYIVAAGSLVKVTPAGVGSTIYSVSNGTFYSVAIDGSGNYIVADIGNVQIARITPGGVSTTVAPIPVLSPETDYDVYVRVDASGNYVMAQDSGNNNIPSLHVYRFTPSGGMTSVTLSGYSIPSFSEVGGLAFDANGNYVIPDPVNAQIYSITPAGVVSLLAAGAPLSRPYGIVRDPSNGNYIVGNLDASNVISVGSTGSPMNTLISGSPVAYPLAIALVSPAGPVTYSPCDVLHEGTTGVPDVQAMINEALGVTSPANDLNGDGVVDVVDIEIDIDAANDLGCLSSVSTQTLSLLKNPAFRNPATHNRILMSPVLESGTDPPTGPAAGMAAPLRPTITAVVNAASFRGGPISPGEFVTLSGTNLGPSTPADAPPGLSGSPGISGGVQVWFDAIPAPLTYVSATQINCVVPYEAPVNGNFSLQVRYQGQTSSPFPLTGIAASPALFTASGSGTGPAAVLNQDRSGNSATSPAAKGSTVTLFVTGEGRTSPPGVTGKVTSMPGRTPQPVLPVAVLIGGQPASVTFYGEAPGVVSGVMQLNVQIPSNVPPGELPVFVSVGGNGSQGGVTVFVRE